MIPIKLRVERKMVYQTRTGLEIVPTEMIVITLTQGIDEIETRVFVHDFIEIEIEKASRVAGTPYVQIELG